MDTCLHRHRRQIDLNRKRLLKQLEKERQEAFQKACDAAQEGATFTATHFQKQHKTLEALIQEIKGGTQDV